MDASTTSTSCYSRRLCRSPTPLQALQAHRLNCPLCSVLSLPPLFELHCSVCCVCYRSAPPDGAEPLPATVHILQPALLTTSSIPVALQYLLQSVAANCLCFILQPLFQACGTALCISLSKSCF